MEYYGVDTQYKDHLSKKGRNHDKLTTYMSNDVASQAIEDSVLDVFELVAEGVRKFMLTRLCERRRKQTSSAVQLKVTQKQLTNVPQFV